MTLDCLIIGGGPAGLTAAIYAARFRLSVRVVDGGHSRAAMIPLTRNHAGFPDGISGPDLLARMREQAAKYGAEIVDGWVESLSRDGEGFIATTAAGRIEARSVLLATGVTNRRPPMDEDLHAAAVEAGRLRYCPVCDGYEVIDRKVAVIGSGSHAAREALFLRAYTADVTLIAPTADDDLEPQDRRELGAAGIRLIDGPAREVALEAEGLGLTYQGRRLVFDAVYPSMGSDVHSALAAEVGAERTEDGCIKVDSHQRTSVPGLYAAGDVVVGLDQISHAMGEAGVAATTIRNDLAAKKPLWR